MAVVLSWVLSGIKMRNARLIKVYSSSITSYFVKGSSSIVIVPQERGKSYEDAGLFSTCTSYSQSSNGDATLSDSQLEVSLTGGLGGIGARP